MSGLLHADPTDVLAVGERTAAADGSAWSLRYMLCRVASGAFVIHAKAEPIGGEASQPTEAAVALTDRRIAERLFGEIVQGGVFPVHLEDILADAAADAAREALSLAPPAN